jgi:GNAT superfamily N-acetyltransferase
MKFSVIFALSCAMTCSVFGQPERLGSAGFTAEDCRAIAVRDDRVVLGLGAFGDNFAACHGRFGEFLAVAGGAAGQPTDGTNYPGQDDFRARSNLTINLGARFDYVGIVFEKNGLPRGLRLDRPGGYLYPEDPNSKSIVHLYDPTVRIWPRLGLAYRPSENMVIRLGGGVYNNVNQMNNLTVVGNPLKVFSVSIIADPATDAAKVRAIFVHPGFARRGLGTAVLVRLPSVRRGRFARSSSTPKPPMAVRR